MRQILWKIKITHFTCFIFNRKYIRSSKNPWKQICNKMSSYYITEKQLNKLDKRQCEILCTKTKAYWTGRKQIMVHSPTLDVASL